MSRYRRSHVPGGTYFFTVALADRRSRLFVDQIERLRRAFQAVRARHSFKTIAICVLPDHSHAVWQLPEGDADYGSRWGLIKRFFSSGLPAATDLAPSKSAKREKGIWQRRFWEHQIRDDVDLQKHIDYLHFNPVKHGLVKRVKDWPHSSFHAYVKRGVLPEDWGGEGDMDIEVGEVP